MNLYQKLTAIQSKLDVPKSHYNKFSDFMYRNIEDIQAALKPLLVENKCALLIHDEIVFIGDSLYVKATVTLSDNESECEPIKGYGYARETMTKPKFDASQLTGSASSYSRKYALTGMFLLDDGADDADGMDNEKPKTQAPMNGQTAKQAAKAKQPTEDDGKPWYNDYEKQKDWFERQINEGHAPEKLIKTLEEKYRVNTTVRNSINQMGGK